MFDNTVTIAPALETAFGGAGAEAWRSRRQRLKSLNGSEFAAGKRPSVVCDREGGRR